MKFVFDGTGVSGEKIDIHDKIQEFFRVVGYDGEEHRPPVSSNHMGQVGVAMCAAESRYYL